MCVFDCLVSFGLIWVNCLCCFVVFVWFDCSSVGCFFLGLLVWLGLVWGDCFVFLLVLFRSSLVWFVCFVWTWLLVLFGCCAWLHRSNATKTFRGYGQLIHHLKVGAARFYVQQQKTTHNHKHTVTTSHKQKHNHKPKHTITNPTTNIQSQHTTQPQRHIYSTQLKSQHRTMTQPEDPQTKSITTKLTTMATCSSQWHEDK